MASSMMSARAKTAPVPPPSSSSSSLEETSTSAISKQGNQLQNLERRLKNLEECGSATAATTSADITTVAPSPQASATATTSNSNNNPLLKRIQAAQERARLAELKEKAANAACQAAETERQRLREEAAWANEERERIQRAQDKLRSVANRAIEDRQRGTTMVQTQQSLLGGGDGILAGGGGIASIATKKASTDSVAASLLAELEQRPTMAIPIMKSLDPPPPSFTSMKFPPPLEMQQQLKQHQHAQPPPQSISEMMMVGHGMNSRVLRETAVVTPTLSPPPPPPPSFDFVERQIMYNTTNNSNITIIEPSAPSISPGTDENDYDLLGVMPVSYVPSQKQQQQQQEGILAPPPPPFPPSFAEFESSQQQFAPAPPSNDVINTDNNAKTDQDEELLTTEDDIDAFKYDENGKLLTHEQRQVMINEQRQLYEQIMNEKAANDTAIAVAKAEEFDLRSSMSATRAMVQHSGSSLLSQSSQEGEDGSTARMGMAGRDINSGGNEEDSSSSTTTTATRRMVQIGNNQMVALHGQERTKKAIKEGTAILVQCINCQNWMQVTESATLMFCPVCQVVSPVVKQTEVVTKEEAIQLTMDRKLAEKLQAEYNSQGLDETVTEGQQQQGGSKKSGEDDGYFSRLFGSSTMKYPATTTSIPVTQTEEGADSTWWNKLSAIVSYGVTTPPTNESVRGELGVTLPPGSTTSIATTSSSTSRYNNEETRGLLSPVTVDENDANLPAARIAESRPLFSCLADSVTSATTALWSSTGSDPELEESLLFTGSNGHEERDAHGDYAQL